MDQGRDAPDECALRGHRLHGSLDVRQMQPGKGCQGFRGVGLRLKRLQQAGLAADALEIRGGQAGSDSVQLPPPRFFALFIESRVWFHDGQQAVGIVQKPGFNDALENAVVFRPLLPDGFDQAGKIEAGQRIAAVQPGMKGAAHQQNPVGIGAALDLPALELHLVQRPLDQVPIEARRDDAAQRLQDQGFDPIGLLWIGAPQPDGKGDLLQIPLQTARGREVFAQPGIDEGLPQRSGGAAD